ncbi:MAG: RNA polymerase sigma factor [Kiritimatiellia bacterium]
MRTDAEIEHSNPSASIPGLSLDVEAALDRLSPKLREVLVLNIYQGLRYHEIAEVLGIPLGTVKSRINLALSAMRKLLGECASDPDKAKQRPDA